MRSGAGEIFMRQKLVRALKPGPEGDAPASVPARGPVPALAGAAGRGSGAHAEARSPSEAPRARQVELALGR